MESATHVFVEPVDGALPREICRSFVIAFRRRVTIETMHGARVDIALVRNVGRTQRLIVNRPRRRQSRVEFPVMHQNCCFDFRDVFWSGRTTIKWRRCSKVRF